MNIKTISYQRVKNLGNYESERLEATADVPEGEDPRVCFVRLKRYVEAQLNIEQEPFPVNAEDF